MRKSLLVFFCSILLASFAQAQKKHKIVLDFTKNDTASFSTVIRHARNIMNLTGNSKIEIVCHGPGLDLLIKDKTSVQSEIRDLSEKFNVVFAACEATMQRRGVSKNQLITQATTVPSAILEISAKEQDGWSYVKE